MIHFFLGMAYVLALSPPAPAAAEQGKSARGDSPAPVTVIKLTVRPATSLPPALKYRLLPDLEELTFENAAPQWLRAGQLVSQQRPGLTEQQSDWGTGAVALQQLLRPEVNKLLESHRAAFQIAEAAARCNRCEWHLPRLGTQDSQPLLLAETQSLRALAYLLMIRIRLEIAEGDFDQALHALRTGFTLAKHVGEGPTTLHALVGASIAASMLTKVEELIQVPEAPNLYWALTLLPRPFLDPRKPLHGEMAMLSRVFPKDVPTTPLTPEQAQMLLEPALREVGRLLNTPAFSSPDRLFATLQVGLIYPDAKRALVAQGFTAEQVEALPTAQVVALHLERKYNDLHDDVLKWTYVPYWQARAGLTRFEQRVRTFPKQEIQGVFFRLTVPPILHTHTALARTERYLAGLRCAEAIRLHAVTHESRLPATLADITDVPLPIDPITGQGFDSMYTLKGGQAVLELPASDPRSTLGRRYEFTPRR